MKLTTYISTYKKDIVAFSSIAFIYSILLIFFWGYMGDLLVDCGREPFLSEEVLKGKLLYKDHIIFFGPLAYYIQALLFKIFGVHLNVIYAAGAFNAFIVLLLSYLISRTITTIKNSWLICFLIITIFFFNNSVSNYIFPYTSCILYAVSAILLSVYFSILYLKTSNPLFIIITGIFYGFSLLSKYEFIFFIVPLALIIFILKPQKFKYILSTALCTLLPLILGYGWLHLNGVTIDDFLNIINTTKELGNLPSLRYFYTCCVGFYPNWLVLKDTFISFIRFMIPFSILIFILYKYYSLASKNRTTKETLILVILIISGCSLSFFIVNYTVNDITFKDFVSFLSWLPIYTALILMFYGYTIIVKALNSNPFEKSTFKKIRIFLKDKIQLKDSIMIFLLLAAIVVTIKGFFFLSLDVYGPFLLLLALIANVIFLFEYIPNYLKIKDRPKWEQSCFAILLMVGSLCILKNTIDIKDQKTGIIQTNRGTIYSNSFISRTMNSAIAYINGYVPDDASILMLPENTILNFLTDRPTGSNYINLLPPNIAIYGEDKIVNDLQKDPPDFIFVNNRNFFNNVFGKNYAKKIMSFILEEYKFEGEIGSKFKIYIFKYNGSKTNE